MRRLRICLLRVLFLAFLSLLLISSGHGQPRKKGAAPTAPSCTSRTGLHCEMYGNGDPILFLPGLGGSTYSWRYMIAPLRRQYQVILIDLRGEGQSPKPKDKNYSIIEQGELVHQFIVEKNLRKLTLVGNSYGGAVSLLLAIKLLEQPQSRLAKLILIDSGGYPDHLPDFLKLLRTPVLGWLAVHLIPPKLQILIVLHKSYYDPGKITKEQVKVYAKPISDRGGRHALLQLGKQAIPDDIQEWIDKYPTISVPTLILWGEDDRVLPRLIGERLHKAIPNSKMELINYAGHIPQEEEPAAVVCQIKKFLMPTIRCPPQQMGKR